MQVQSSLRMSAARNETPLAKVKPTAFQQQSAVLKTKYKKHTKTKLPRFAVSARYVYEYSESQVLKEMQSRKPSQTD